MALFDTIRAGASAAGGGYQVERSLRFNHHDNAYLTYIPSSDGNRQKWTWSGWVKRVRLGSTTYGLFTSQNDGDGGGNNGVSSIYFGSDDKIHVYYDTTGSNHSGSINDNVYRDTHAWYHIVWQVDAANSTSKIFVNGVSQTVNVQPVSGYNYTMNQAGKRMTYGIDAWDLYTPASSYVAECHYSDGQLYDADVFAETDSETGQWVPKASPAITYGTNGHYLNFSDNSNNTAATIGKDYSGQGNNFTPTNISVSAGTSNDSLEDTPTNNFCVISRLDSWRSSTEVEDGSLKFRRHASNFGPARGTFAVKTGKWYFEFTKGSGLVQAGFVNTDQNLNYNGGDNGLSGSGNNACGIAYDSRGFWYGYTGSNPSSIANDDIIGVAFDADNFKFYFHKNGTYYGSGNPSTGSNGIEPNHSNTVTKTDNMMFAPYFNGENGNGYANFGQRPFVHTIPTGYQSLCTANLPEPTIALPTDHFNPLLYTGNGGTNAISGLDFQPDWVWLKKRNGSTNHLVFDSVRGINRSLNTNGTGGEDTSSTTKLTSFNSDGFTLGSNSSGNNNGDSYVAWNWYAPTSFSNSAGSNGATIASTGKVNQTAGFSIVSYTGNATRDQKVYHGLNAAPKWMLIKRRDGDNWISYHDESNATNPQRYYYEFQNTDSRKGDSTAFMWDDIVPDSNTFGIYSDGAVNNNGSNIIAYIFSEVVGYSKFGHYVGNGNSDGTFINLNFRPALVIVKANDGEPWVMYDNKRTVQNPVTKRLRANSSDSEDDASGRYKDFYANGFKARGTSGEQNSSGQRYIYMAWAETPFKYARAR